jgi:prepilin-type N-terminal cleavage/methylation domain-containing protein
MFWRLKRKESKAFTLIEVLVVVSIIGILVSILTLSFTEARKNSRDSARRASLKQLQLALETYKAQNGSYPPQGCGTVGVDFAGPGPVGSGFASCDTYITGLAPDFIATLPRDPNQENDNNAGFFYKTNASGSAYKVMINKSVESQYVNSYNDEFARCPSMCVSGSVCNSSTPGPLIYAVYSKGAECW